MSNDHIIFITATGEEIRSGEVQRLFNAEGYGPHPWEINIITHTLDDIKRSRNGYHQPGTITKDDGRVLLIDEVRWRSQLPAGTLLAIDLGDVRAVYVTYDGDGPRGSRKERPMLNPTPNIFGIDYDEVLRGVHVKQRERYNQWLRSKSQAQLEKIGGRLVRWLNEIEWRMQALGGSRDVDAEVFRLFRRQTKLADIAYTVAHCAPDLCQDERGQITRRPIDLTWVEPYPLTARYTWRGV